MDRFQSGVETASHPIPKLPHVPETPPMHAFRTLVPVALAVSLAATAASAQVAVHVVDSLDPGAFHGVSQAVAAAADGDVILVRSLDVESQFTVSGKSLVIAADAGLHPLAITGFAQNNHLLSQGFGHTIISDLLPGQRVVLRGVHFGGLDLADVAGQVWLEDALVNFTSPAMRATNVDSLVLHDVELKGPSSVNNSFFWKIGGDGLELAGSGAVVHGVLADGGTGHDFSCTAFPLVCSNSSGFDAVQMSGSSSLWLAGATLHGGNGGTGGFDGFTCWSGGNGGHGLLLASGSPHADLRAVTATGGFGAPGPAPGSCLFGGGDGVDGQPVATLAGGTQVQPGTAVTLDAPSPLREGETLAVSVSGPAGLPLILLAGAGSGVLSIGAVSGPLLTGVPQLILPVGAVPAGGTLTLQATVPELGPGVQALSWTLQVVTVQAGQRIAGPATSLLLLDGSI
jgi:hypothetical protein